MAHFDGGYFRVHRKMFNPTSDFYGDGHAIAVFMCLLDLANWKDGTQPLRKQRVTLKRGQLVTKLDQIVGTTGFAKTTVFRVLKRLQKWNVIGMKADHDGSIVTIHNYDLYQSDGDECETNAEQDRNASATADATADATYPKKEKKEKKKNNTPGTKSPPKERLLTWTEDDPYARCFANLSEFPKYWDIFDREKDRKTLESHRTHYSLSVGDMEQITFDLKHWADGPNAAKVKSPRGTLGTFVKRHVDHQAERKQKDAPKKKSLFEIYGVKADGSPL